MIVSKINKFVFDDPKDIIELALTKSLNIIKPEYENYIMNNEVVFIWCVSNEKITGHMHKKYGVVYYEDHFLQKIKTSLSEEERSGVVGSIGFNDLFADERVELSCIVEFADILYTDFDIICGTRHKDFLEKISIVNYGEF